MQGRVGKPDQKGRTLVLQTCSVSPILKRKGGQPGGGRKNLRKDEGQQGKSRKKEEHHPDVRRDEFVSDSIALLLRNGGR